MENIISTGIADVVGGSSVRGALSATAGLTAGSVVGHAASVVRGLGRDADTDTFRPRVDDATPMSFRRYAGNTSPSRGSTRPEVVELV